MVINGMHYDSKCSCRDCLRITYFEEQKEIPMKRDNLGRFAPYREYSGNMIATKIHREKEFEILWIIGLIIVITTQVL